MRNRWQVAGWLSLSAAAFLAAACGPGTSSSGSNYSLGSSSSSKAATSSSKLAGTLKTAKTSAGTILTSAGGFALYYYSVDKPGSGKSACTGGCATAWPALTASVKAPSGVTLPGPLGTITLSGGKKQVTIKGYPIYTYAGDHSPGQISGNGAEGEWHVIKVSGGAAASSTATSAATSAGSTGGAGGYGY